MASSFDAMPKLLQLDRYSLGVGDRFGQQAKPQLRACLMAAAQGTPVTPVWNKSNREHLLIGSHPGATRAAAETAVRQLGWSRPYHLDADHITPATVSPFLAHCDFFTVDVAERLNQPAGTDVLRGFLRRHPELVGTIAVPGIEQPLRISASGLERIASRFLSAVEEVGNAYQKIVVSKGEGTFILEVSMDETDRPQTPADLLVILAALADQGMPVQTLAPKFSGRFNKGVDYVGDLGQFDREFGEDVAIVAFAVGRYTLPNSLKLSVHSGSDKFSLYPIIRKHLEKSGAGLHLKTAGTSWLEELAGLAESGEADALGLAKEICQAALGRLDELSAPYAAVIEIDRTKLPLAPEVQSWTAEQFTTALWHDTTHPAFNPDFRQLMHVAFKIAAEMGERYLETVRSHEELIGRRVTDNLYERHIRPLFPRA